jgi:flavin-dependent dehydrogenase
MAPSVFDVIIVGGGIAGSTLGGVLARSGLGVLVLEKEERFRDQVRGESKIVRHIGAFDVRTGR